MTRALDDISDSEIKKEMGKLVAFQIRSRLEPLPYVSLARAAIANLAKPSCQDGVQERLISFLKSSRSRKRPKSREVQGELFSRKRRQKI